MIQYIAATFVFFVALHLNNAKDCSFEVDSIDHSSGALGQYFNFYRDEVDDILGQTNWDGSTVLVVNSRTSILEEVMIWRVANGGSSGTAHGRKNPKSSSAGGDWKVNDILTVVDDAIDCKYQCTNNGNPTALYQQPSTRNVVDGIEHTGLNYLHGDDQELLEYISGTSTSDNLRNNGNGWPLVVRWTDRRNNAHTIKFTNDHSDYTLYFPCSSEINWHHGGGTDRTGLDAETKWARVKFSHVDSNMFNSHGIRVTVQGYRYKTDTAYQIDWERIKEGVAMGKDVVDIVKDMSEIGKSIASLFV